MQVPSWMPVIFYAVVTMLFIGIYSRRRIENETEQKPFSNLVFLTVIILVNDFISRLYIFDGFPHWLVVATTYINFATLNFMGVFWYRFVRSVLSIEERAFARRLDILIFIITAIGLGSLLVNPFIGTIFSFDSLGDYHRGPIFYFPAGATFLCIVISEIFISFRVRSLGSSVFLSMLIFPVPPLIGGVVAMFFYGIPWMPLGVSLSMLILFTSLHTTSLGKDFLTGLLNRRRIDELLAERIALAQRGRTFAMISADLDDFKNINDTLGHSTGDIALARAAQILRSSVREEDEVARWGGDEFIILLDTADKAIVEGVVERIHAEIERFNATNTRFKLAMSMGHAIFDPKKYESLEAFSAAVDERMYTNKQQRKANKTISQAS